VPLGPQRPLVLDATYPLVERGCVDRGPCDASAQLVRVGAGLPLAVSNKGPLEGLLLQPRVVLSLLTSRLPAPPPALYTGNVRVPGGALQVGVELGYQGVLDRLYIAPVLGVSAGLGANMAQPSVALSAYQPADAPGLRPVLDFNLNLLRVGLAF